MLFVALVALVALVADVAVVMYVAEKEETGFLGNVSGNERVGWIREKGETLVQNEHIWRDLIVSSGLGRGAGGRNYTESMMALNLKRRATTAIV